VWLNTPTRAPFVNPLSDRNGFNLSGATPRSKEGESEPGGRLLLIMDTKLWSGDSSNNSSCGAIQIQKAKVHSIPGVKQ